MKDNNTPVAEKGKTVRTPKSPDSITAGALKMKLAERVALVKTLQTSITKEVADLKYLAEEAAQTANGLGE